MTDTRQIEMKYHELNDRTNKKMLEVHRKIDKIEAKLDQLEKILVGDGK